MAVNKKIFPYLTAAILLVLPFLAMPLAFCRFTGRPFPLYGLVTMVTLPVIALFSAGMLLFFPERLKQLLSDRKLWPLAASSILLTAVAGYQTLTGMITAEGFLTVMFYLLTPMAGAIAAEELKKLLPVFAPAAAGILIYSGVMSEKFTGLTGNWNWTQGAVVALLPGILLLRKKWYDSPAKWKYALIFPGIFLLLFAIFFPDGVSRSALTAAVLTAGMIFTGHRLTSPRSRNILILAFLAVAAVVFAVAGFAGDSGETRIHIWRGAAGVIGEYFLTGCGQFSEYIRMYLPEAYFFSSFPAPHIDHAHNDLLNIFAENGIAGAIFYITAIWTILRRQVHSAPETFCRWIFLTLLICGWFDQHNITVLCGTLLTLSAGIQLASGRHPEESVCRWRPAAIPLGAAAIIYAFFMMAVNLSSGSFIRRGDLQLFRGDIAGAVRSYNDSIREKPTVHALYQLAELSLVTQRPDRTFHYLEKLESDCARRCYRHSQRLKGVAAMMTGNFTVAAEAMTKELKNAPFSIINARWNYLLLCSIGTAPQTRNAAWEHLRYLCSLRGITPEAAATLSPAVDDGAFPVNP